MAVALASKSSSNGSNGDVTITKPSSLAEGDIMVAFISSTTEGPGGEAHAGPSGWTILQASVVSNGSVLTVWGVKATSTQTGAADFTWTSAGTNANTLGAIYRITGDDGFLSLATNVASVANSALTTTGVTTLSDSSMPAAIRQRASISILKAALTYE